MRVLAMACRAYPFFLVVAFAACSSGGAIPLPDGGTAGRPGTGTGEGGTTLPEAGVLPEGGPTGGRQLLTLASGPTDFLVLDATSAYVAAVENQAQYALSILRIPLAGGASTTLASGLESVTGIAVSAAGVYWVDAYTPNPTPPDASPFLNGVVMGVPAGGGTATTLATALANPQAIVADGVNLYWADTSPQGFSGQGTIMSMPAAGGTPTQLVKGPYQPAVLALDAASLYWGTSDGRLMKIAKAGGTATQLAFYETSIGNLVVDATSVYWTTSSGDLMKTPVGGGPSTALLVGTSSLGGIAVDSASVYFTMTDYPAASVQKVPLAGGPPETLWSGSDSPGAIQVDATSVYFSTYQGGLMKLTPK
jgi:hypothetical protein